MDAITLATHEWAAAQVGTHPENVKSVEFTTIEEGYCETCAYTTCGVSVDLKNGRTRTHTMEYASMSDVVREITALVKP